ncbi:hypothetical protein [Mucisphaera sp.]|uniref:hypothetical protein n=1 Tax=Mucisphaera sp. TaxID=2913024 RepID=UPI003D14A354
MTRACTAVLLLLAFIFPGGLADASESDVDQFNYILGTQTIGARYQFTEDTFLVETAKRIRAMGSNHLKVALSYKYSGETYGLPHNPDIQTVVDLARDEPSFRYVLDMPFAYYHLWVYCMGTGGFSDGMSEEEKQLEYQQMYDLTAHLLTTYSGTGKTFYLGHWEGDWHLHPDYDGSKDPSDILVKGMLDWLVVRQRAIDDAKHEVPHDDVQIYHYTELSLVDKAMNGGKTLTNNILPYIDIDYVSWSAYDRLGWGGQHGTYEGEELERRLWDGLDYIESKLRPREGLPPGKRIWIGEYGYPLETMKTPEAQEAISRATAAVALEWGCPFVLYWEMYCNENRTGEHKGFWLIDSQNVKQPFYYTLEAYYAESRAYVARFLRLHGHPPSDKEYRAFAAGLLRKPAKTPESLP